MADLTSHKSSIWKYYLVEFLGGFWFILPIFLIYFQSFGLSYSNIALLEAVGSTIVIILEIPTGVFADFVGKKWSVFIGCVTWSMAFLIIGMGSVFSIFLLGYSIWAVGDAFFSGAQGSLLYDITKKIRMEKYFLKFKGRVMFIQSLSVIIGSIVGAYVYVIDRRLPWLLFAVSVFAAGIVVASIAEPFKCKKKFNLRNQFDHMNKSVRFSLSHREIRWLIIFLVLSSFPIMVFVNLMEQVYLTDIGISVIGLGVTYAITRGLLGLMSNLIYKVEKRLGERTSFYLITISYSSILILMGLLNLPIMVVLVTLLIFTRDYKRALIEKYTNKHVESYRRATVLSAQSLFVNIFSVFYFLIGGFLLNVFPLNTVLILLGLASITLLPLLISKYR